MKNLFVSTGGSNRLFWRSCAGLFLLLLLNSLISTLPTTQAAPLGAGWQDTGFIPPTNYCIDGSQPDTLFYNLNFQTTDGNPDTYAYNWRTAKSTKVSNSPFDVCDSANGIFFGKEGTKFRRFTSRDPQGKLVDYSPTYFAHDGSQQLYAFEYGGGRKLVSSSDGGLTWQVRPRIIGGYSANFVVSPSDARSIYTAECEYGKDCLIYFSADAGASWEKRSTNAVNATAVGLDLITGPSTPVNYVLVRQYSTAQRKLMLSLDGGRTFTSIGQFGANDSPSGTNPGENIELYYTGQNLVRFSALTSGVTLSQSKDGQTWENLTLPTNIKPLAKGEPHPFIQQLPNSPTSFILNYTPQGSSQENLWYTTDGGHTWNDLGPNMFNLRITPYLPTSLIGNNGTGQLQVQEFTQTDKFVTAKVTANNSAGSVYFPETGHNLAGPIRKFWEQNGGLAQFGYPQTEVIKEYNPADGKVYSVQYFERNRMEYHPELAGTKYEVLLGLLGNQLTENRRQEGPFKPVSNPNQAGFTYFPETGHTLAHTFKEYWEAHGGLALYGFPVSEEFQEVNPDDGKTYTVQYFERNRFEYHPENKGTKYEVLLGLLGNTLLKQKGWL